MKPNNKWVRRISLFVIGIYAVIAFIRVISLAFTVGGKDFHAYWYDGVYLRQGTERYAAFQNGFQAASPMHFLIGPTIDVPVDEYNSESANPALGILLFSLFSLMSFEFSRIVWMIANLFLLILLPWLLVRYFRQAADVSRDLGLLLSLVFYILLPVRNAAGNGQSTIFVFFLMILTLYLANRNEWLAGIAMAFSLIKFSVSFPILIWLLLARKWRTLVTTVFIHVFSLIVYAILTSSDPLRVLPLMWEVLVQRGLAKQGVGIELMSLSPTNGLSVVAMVLLAIPIAFLLARSWRCLQFANKDQEFILYFHIVNLVILYVLLAFYSSFYDAVAYYFFIAFTVVGLANNAWWGINRTEKTALIIFLIVSIGVLSLPGAVLATVLPDQATDDYIGLIRKMTTISMMIAYCISLVMLSRYVTRSSFESVRSISE
ncbi:MAG: DUF2029 domain-containing protein [Anaerolineae bacterium]|nr:DUF2029 domain-containing protein [Anaerolineae bacterium]